MIKESMLANVRKAAGLGSPPATFYTHCSESNNHVIKHKECYREVSLPQFVGDMKQLRRDYEDDFVKAITGRGEYRMKYSHLELTTDQWFNMTIEQRDTYVRKIRSLSMLEVLQGESCPLQSVGLRTSTESESCGLSCSFKTLQSPLDEAVLENMWKKAAGLVASPSSIQRAPYCEKVAPATPVFLVVSGTNSREFYSVECDPSLSTVAKCSCAGMKSSGIRSHALAVCEKQGLLSQFLQYYSTKKSSVNLTNINLGNKQDHRSVGRKPNQPRKRFKGPMPQNEVVVECQKVFASNSSTHYRAESQLSDAENHASSHFHSFEHDERFSTGIPGSAFRHSTERSQVPSFDEPGRPFSFLEFLYDTNVMQTGNVYTAEGMSAAHPQNVADLSTVDFYPSQGPVVHIHSPQSSHQMRPAKPPFPKSNLNYDVCTIWGNVKKSFGCKYEFLPAPAPDNQYVLVRLESDWYFNSQPKTWRLGRKSN